MTDDPYRGFAAPREPRPDRPAEDGTGFVRPVLWLLLVVFAVANMVTSSVGGLNVFIGIGFGLATLACGIALVVHHRGQRRS
ncbi:hypothetical protein [Streptomyces sp. NBRC 110028]|uniref:hypothetical protein n=1 Tax=Streptomyces sp. NBRC 110028 TaxID=1621260 RepID=UPI0006E124B2|nr:hypothetical protein [Streptomyces sp. NBRC 110028]